MSNDEKRQTLREQLEYLHRLDEINLKNRFAIKNWCIVVWLGVIVILLKEKSLSMQASAIEPALIIFLPVFLFWFLEAVYGGQNTIYRKQIRDFEQKINTESLASYKTGDLFARSHYEEKVGLCQKLLSFFCATFSKGTLTHFYLAMLIASTLVVYFIFPGFINSNFCLFGLISSIIVVFTIIARYLKNKIELKE